MPSTAVNPSDILFINLTRNYKWCGFEICHCVDVNLLIATMWSINEEEFSTNIGEGKTPLRYVKTKFML